ncbi:hypothetical protein LINGRAHAP2_LOCUS38357 [Linum grandiflorum]
MATWSTWEKPWVLLRGNPLESPVLN